MISSLVAGLGGGPDRSRPPLSQSTNKIVVVQGNAVPAFSNLPLVSGQSLGVTNSNYINLGKKNFAPRIGFAYRPFNSSRFVVRASYGIFYNPMSEYDDVIDARDLGLNPPFRATYSYTTVAGAAPTLTFANPFPGQGTASGTATTSFTAGPLRLSLLFLWRRFSWWRQPAHY